MADETTTTQDQTQPQQQPGPSRTADGTIIDQATQTKPPTTQPDTSPKPDSSTGTTKPAEAAAGAPEKYADFKVAEGFVLDPKVAEEVSGIFKGMNLSQENAQKLVDFYSAKTQEAQEAPFKAFADMTKAWKDEVAKTYGKDIEPGGKHSVSVARLLSQLGPTEAGFREAMDNTGAGSHPAFVAAFIKLAEMLGEGTHVPGNQPSPLGQTNGEKAPPSLAQAMYPHLPSANAGR
jgi:hypothetical protein